MLDPLEMPSPETSAHAMDKTEAEITDTIVALDWSADVLTRPLSIICEHYAIPDAEAVHVLLGFHDRHLLICGPEQTTAPGPPGRARWVRPEARA